MRHYYSASTGGFYCDLNSVIPNDAVEIDESYKIDLLEKQQSGFYSIEANANGYPMAVLNEPETVEAWRARTSIKKAQAWLNLASKGLLQTTLDKIRTLPEVDSLRIMFEHSESYHRNDIRLVEFCTDELNLTPEQIDALFIVQ